MDSRPVAEVYDELKELRRRRGRLDTEIQLQPNSIGKAYTVTVRVRKESYAAAFGLGEDFSLQLRQLVVGESSDRDQSASLIRTLGIKTLADRVFGDEKKADAWLQRPNSALSGQRPADLLKDELGAAVVRETLERIDHGIFA
ncbi:MAG TPA: MbcA/ParS/Xre antitoxin family protein [Bradyrhizobium sp.]|jgi:putative toxin-antitoxin system antitoxin component (TIGR02293 family)|nr:MbcA/ParS/Xre antitoxin family protein [Bradyrhizobium sp.]